MPKQGLSRLLTTDDVVWASEVKGGKQRTKYRSQDYKRFRPAPSEAGDRRATLDAESRLLSHRWCLQRRRQFWPLSACLALLAEVGLCLVSLVRQGSFARIFRLCVACFLSWRSRFYEQKLHARNHGLVSND